MTKKQLKELKVIKYFIPKPMQHITISDDDIEMYFEWSEKGKHKDLLNSYPTKMDGLNALVQGKVWAGRHIEMYEEGVLDGTMPYFEILFTSSTRKWYNPMRYILGKFKYTKIPPEVKDFMKKQMFQGIDAQSIEDLYNPRRKKKRKTTNKSNLT